MEYDKEKVVYTIGYGITVFDSNAQRVCRNTFASNSDAIKQRLSERHSITLINSLISEVIAIDRKPRRIDLLTETNTVGLKAVTNDDYAGIVFLYFLLEEAPSYKYRIQSDNQTYVGNTNMHLRKSSLKKLNKFGKLARRIECLKY